MGFWTSEHDEHLRVCFTIEGMTAREAASSINVTFKTGYSRNAIIGRALRLKIQSANPPHGRGVSTPRPRPKMVKMRLPRPKMPKPLFKCDDLTGLRNADVEPLNLDLLELGAQQCRWPYGDGPFTFCAHPTHDDDLSYCPAHMALSFKAAA